MTREEFKVLPVGTIISCREGAIGGRYVKRCTDQWFLMCSYERQFAWSDRSFDPVVEDIVIISELELLAGTAKEDK